MPALEQKKNLRSKIATVMLLVSRNRRDNAAEEFWSYVLVVVDTLGHNGMSDEEEDDEEMEDARGGSRILVRKIKILKSSWRHEYFEELFHYVDMTRLFEQHIFRAHGGKSVERERVDQVSERLPPKNIPRSFFREGYFDGKMDVEVDLLRLSPRDIPLRSFNFHGRGFSFEDDDQ